jgi:membrane-bound serine protease (ClpP class)
VCLGHLVEFGDRLERVVGALVGLVGFGKFLLLAVEIFVLPGFGVAGVSGILLILISMVLACQNFIVPQTEHDWGTLLSSSFLVLSSCAGFAVVAGVMMRYFHVIPVLNNMILAPPVPTQSATDLVAKLQPDGSKNSGHSLESAVQVGSIGRTETSLRPIGRARFGDAFVDVVCEGDYVPRGASIRVLEISEHKVIVEAVDPNAD